MSPSIPEKVGRYEITGEMGRGGMSTVYSAHDPMFDRDVAIKILPRELLHDPMFRARFEREAQTIATLEHPAILPVYDFGEADGQPFFVMRLMTGGSLADRLNQGPLPLDEAVRIITIIAGALDEAHQRGIVHRDLKPGNILFDQHNDPFLADFGIAKLNEAGATLTGNVIVGTPAYMSPEQGRGDKDLDGRSDIYSLGVILFEMLTGRIPFQADTPMGQIIKHMNSPIPEILTYQPDLPPDIQIVINRAMHKRKFGRFNTAGEMAQALQAMVAGAPVPAPQSMPTFATLPGAEPAPLPNESTSHQTDEHEIVSQRAGQRGKKTPQPRKKISWFWRFLRTIAFVLFSLMLLAALVAAGTPIVIFKEYPETFYARVVFGIPATPHALVKSATPEPSSTPVPPATHTPLPTKTPITTLRPSSTPILLPTKTSPPADTPISIYPVRGTLNFPAPDETLTADNLDRIKKIVVTGNGLYQDIAVSNDATTLAVASNLGVDLYDLESFDSVGWLPSQNPVHHLAFSPDGKLLAAAELETVDLWDWQTHTLVNRLAAQEGDLIEFVNFSPTGQYLWGGSSSTQIWKTADGSQIRSVDGVPAQSVSISMDDKLLAAPTANSVELLLLSDGSLQQELRAYGAYRAQFLPDGDTLLVIANDLVHVFSLLKGELNPSIGGQVPVISWNGGTLVSDNGEGKIQTWKLSGNSVPGFPFRQFDQIGYSLADNHESNYQVSQNGEYLAYWNNWEGNYMFQDLIETNRSWSGNLSSSSHLNIYNYGYPNYSPLTKLLFSPLDPQTVVALWQNSIIEAWDFTTSQTHRSLSWEYDYSYTQVSSNTQNEYTMPAAKQSVNSLDNTLNARADSGKVLVTKMNDSTLVYTILANATQNTDLVFSPDSSTLATISSGPTIRLWRMSDGRQVCVVNGNGDSPDIANAVRLFFSDDGRILAVYHQNGELSYWDAQNCRRQETYWLKNTSISPDGSFFIEPQLFQLNLRKLNDGSLIQSLYGDFDRNLNSNKFGFSKDGKFIGAVYIDGTGHLWGIVP